MMHCFPDFKYKKDLKAAVAAGRRVEAVQPGGFFPGTRDGVDVIEGPAIFHRWYARVRIEDGVIKEVIS